jgi:hypothetical protein
MPFHITTHPGKSATESIEQKVAALTQQLEDDMEKSPHGEYFGKAKFRGLECTALYNDMCFWFLDMELFTI